MDGKDSKSVLSHEEDVALSAPELAKDHAALAPEVVQEKAELAPELVEPAGRGQKAGAMNIIENPLVVRFAMLYPSPCSTMNYF